MVRIFFILLMGLLRRLPYPVFRAFTAPFICLFYLFSTKLRRHARETLGIAFGDSLTLKEKDRIGAASFFNLMSGLMDIPYYATHPDFSARSFAIKGGELLERARAQGKGAVIAVAHFGPFVTMLYRFVNDGYPVKIVMRPPRSKAWRKTLHEHPHTVSPDLIYSVPLRECVVACSTALKSNELLVMPIDQNYGGPGRIFVDFFGRKAATAAGPAAYAFKTGAPLLTAFARPTSPGKWEILLAEVPLDRTQDERHAVRQATQTLTTWVETQARAYPDQWSWMHRRWKAVPKENE